MIGEYLGEGCVLCSPGEMIFISMYSDEENISIMHSFVDLLDFRNTSFVDALRNFLQAFRLPGEAQKIDRYMLKFAERYIAGNPQTQFANAGRNTIEMMQRRLICLRCRYCLYFGILYNHAKYRCP
jgi:brefeldin A-inhibited guanine nucleotide-exchange protein